MTRRVRVVQGAQERQRVQALEAAVSGRVSHRVPDFSTRSKKTRRLARQQEVMMPVAHIVLWRPPHDLLKADRLLRARVGCP